MRLERVHDRLWQAASKRRVVGDEHTRRAVLAERSRPAIVKLRAGQERNRLATQRGRLAQRAEAVGRERATVVIDEHDDRPHSDHAPLGQKLDDRAGAVSTGVLDPPSGILRRRR